LVWICEIAPVAYCVLNEAGEIVLEHKLASTPEAMKQVFGVASFIISGL